MLGPRFRPHSVRRTGDLRGCRAQSDRSPRLSPLPQGKLPTVASVLSSSFGLRTRLGLRIWKSVVAVDHLGLAVPHSSRPHFGLTNGGQATLGGRDRADLRCYPPKRRKSVTMSSMPQMTSMALRQKDRPFFVADGCVGGGGSYVTPPIWRSGGYQLRSGACHHPGPCGALFIVPSYQFVGSKTGRFCHRQSALGISMDSQRVQRPGSWVVSCSSAPYRPPRLSSPAATLCH